jgi:hypothetical protein
VSHPASCMSCEGSAHTPQAVGSPLSFEAPHKLRWLKQLATITYSCNRRCQQLVCASVGHALGPPFGMNSELTGNAPPELPPAAPELAPPAPPAVAAVPPVAV